MKFCNAKRVTWSWPDATIGILAMSLSACGPTSPPQLTAQPAKPPAQPAPRQEAKATPPRNPEAPQASADAGLAARVKNALHSERMLRAYGIDVDARDGEVTLFGSVESPMKIEMALTVARNVNGVKSVVNKLVVVAGS